METVFISKLKPLLDAVDEKMKLYVPLKVEQHYTYVRHDPSGKIPAVFNEIRTFTPVKEFLFPLRELAAVFPEPQEPHKTEPFAVFGLKDCDLRSIRILDKVFGEDEFQDQFYINRRKNMFIISTDCTEPDEHCFCNLFDGQGFAGSGFDLNVSKIKDGFIVEAGSQKGRDFIEKNSSLFADAPDVLLAERTTNRKQVKKQLEQNNAEFQFDKPIKQILTGSQDSEIFDIEAENCIECQACTRICPTCHCFYLYDTKIKDYFAKMKIWDSCMRLSYAAVAGGANPHKMLGDRIKHRLMHKFVYFLDRYDMDMCVGCGRCIDCAGGMDIRRVLKKLNNELEDKNKEKEKTKAAK